MGDGPKTGGAAPPEAAAGVLRAPLSYPSPSTRAFTLNEVVATLAQRGPGPAHKHAKRIAKSDRARG